MKPQDLTGARQDIVFIDAGVGDVAGLLGSIRPGVEVHVVHNGLAGIAQILADRQDVDSVQIISHGQANAITLNGQVLHAESLAAYASELQTIGAALAPQGDILLYGCNTGATDAEHADFVSALAAATGRDVAASTDNSGSAQLGGNWVLERHTGTIEAGLFASGSAVSYGDLLAAPTSETFDGVTPSAGTNGAARVINGWTFSLLGANGSSDPGGAVNVTNDTNQSSLVNGGSDHAAEFLGTYASSGTGQAAAVLAATSGEEFALQSIVVEQGLSDGNDYRLVGYRDGSAVSGATQDFTAGAYVDGGGTLVTVSGSAWQNLDAVRIVRQGGQTDIGIYVDDITVGAVVRPTATVVVADTALAVGETSLVTFTFSQAVTGFTNGDLSIPNGSLSTVTSGDGGVTWTATFTPTASTTDSTNVITLNMAGVSAVATTVAGTGTQNSNNYAIDTVRPTATLVMADTALRVGETSGLTITFSEAVTGFTNADLSVANGTLSAVSSGDGGITWTATFTPTASTTDATNLITLANTGVTDAAGNAGSGTTDSNNYAIDTVRPTASIVVADNDLAVGETSGVTITFSEAVTGFTNADLTVTNGTLSAVNSINGGITWTATFTPTASITDATNVITLANTGVTDAAGNAGSGTTNSNNYTIDTARPTATIVVADNALSIGETSLVTITFSEAVSGFDNSALTVFNGTLSTVSTSDDITFTATFTPTASVTDATNLITLDNTYVADAAGNAGSGTTNSNNYAIDTVRPTASIVVADSNLLAGETSLVTITFSEAVTGFTNADLTIANGTLSAVSSGDGGITWTATFTPTASITDATNLITLANTGVADAAGNAGTGTTDSNNYAIATVRPTASIVVADTSLTVGETSLVTITFSEAVTGFTNADLTIANGTLSAVSSGDGGITWTATFTPTASLTDATNVITLANTGVTSAAGNAGSGTTDSNNYAIDTVRPTATLVMADTALRVGETSGLTITFSEAVTGFTNADLSVANGTLSAVSSGDGGITWTATFTPTASTTDATNLITLANTGVTDAAGNAGSGTTDSNNYAIDTVRPTASIVVADTALAAGETSLVTITFSEAVTGFTNADLTVTNGTLSAVSSGDGGITWTATFTPTASITDATNVITLANTGVVDAAGNAGTGTTDSNNYAIDTVRPTASIVVADSNLLAGETSLVTITFSEAVTGFTNADLTIANGTLSAVSSGDGGITWTATFTPTASLTDATNVITLANTGVTNAAGNTGSGTTDSNNYAIATVRPTASIVVADTSLTVGETSLVTITFSEAVTGFTNADLTIANGTLSAVSSGDGGITWTATFTPTASLTDATNVITLANTGVTNAAGNTGSGTTDSNNYAIDTARPTASIVIADTALAIGETSLVTITFSEAVTGFTNADLTIANGTLSAVSTGDGGITWTATFTPTASITNATNVITLANTGVIDAAGNTGSGTTDSNNYAIDTARPTATLVMADNALSIGETSLVTITFSEAVTGFTNADLTIANGTLSAVSSGDGGITWTATFTPTASITNATNVITLANTGVTDAAGNTGSGTTDSNNYAIDGVRPTASVVVADTALAAGETSLVTITFSEAVTGFTNTDLAVVNGTLSAVGSSDGGITWTATFTPTASTTDATNVITLDNTGVQDGAGNAGAGTTDSNNYAVDTLPPVLSTATVTGNQLVLGYAEATALDAANAAPNGAFAVLVGAAANAVTGVAVNAAAKTVTLTLATAVVAGEAVTVAYTDPTGGNDANATQDAAGNDAAGFAAMAATNLTPAIPDPVTPTPATPPDNDGIPAAVEDQVPGIPGPGGTRLAGDGNGDGIKDSEQAGVASTGFALSPTGASNPGSSQPTFITLVAGSQGGKVGVGNDNARITSLVQKDAPADLPHALETPLGLVSFTAALAPGKTTESFSLYLDPALGVNGYWKQDSTTGTWVNLASEPYGGKMVMEGGRLRLDFQITDGGSFDADGKVNGIITEPGAPGHMPLSITGQPPDMPHGTFWF